MKIKAKLGAYSSIVGQPVLLLGEGGRAEAQITLLHHGDMFRDRAKQIELLTVIVNAINAAGDPRPFNCRFRLKETGQPYPRGGCNACGRSVTTGLGNQCSAVDGTLPLEVSQGTVSLEAMLRDESLMMARTEVADEVAKLQGYKDELLKIAAMVGEPEDPFAAWESIDHMLRRYVHMQNALIGLSHMIEQNTTGDPEPPHQVRIEGVLYGGPLADNFVNSMQAIKQVCINALGDIPVEVTVEEPEVDTDVPYPPKTNADVMNALGAATIKADKIDLDNSGATVPEKEPQKKPKTMKDVAAAFLDVMAAEREQDPLKKYTTFTPATDTEAAHPYTVGPRTMREVFEPAGLQNLSDMQALLDAVEAGLIRVAKRY